MAWMIFALLDKTGTDASKLMIRRALESDVLSARLVAQSLNRDLGERERELSDLAKRIGEEKWTDQLRTAIAKPAVTEEAANQLAFRILNSARTRSDERSAKLGLKKDFSWFLTDVHGIQKWRNPFIEPGANVSTVGRSFAFRDYFNGRGQDASPTAPAAEFQPIREPHISHRFLGPGGSYYVAVTVPVWDLEHKQILGVLGRSIEIGSLLDEYGQAIFEEDAGSSRPSRVSREIALIERVQGNLLDHTWFDKNDEVAKNQPLKISELDALRVSAQIRERLAELGGTDGGIRREFALDAHYVDPLSQYPPASADLAGEWLAAFAPVPQTNWVTVVQERRTVALEPVQEMKRRLTSNGLWALFGSCLLIGALWYFVGRALNDRTSRVWTPRHGRRQGDKTETGPRTPSGSARM
jgi:eukaryotic-like serine/threonine-protein kinase